MILAKASCLGHAFAIDRLEIAMQQSQEQLHVELQAIYNAGLAYCEEEIIHFAHDRVQEAAYSLALISDTEKKSIHLLMGRQLLQKSLNQENPLNLFEIIDHLNQGLVLINDYAERIGLAKLNLLAGQKAKNAVAYMSGLNYIQAGLSCLDEQLFWTQHYSLTFALYREKAELEHSASQFEQAEITMQLLIDHAKTVIEKADIYNLLITQQTLLTKDSEAIQLGKTALALLELTLPETDEALAVRFEQEQTEINQLLECQDLMSFAKKPDLEDAHKKATLKLLLSLLGTTYVSNRPLYNVVTASSVKLSLQAGPIAEAALGFVFYGSILGGEFKTARLGYEFGQLAVQLCERYQILAQICKSFYLIAIIINPWFKSLEECRILNSTALQAGLDSGEMQYAGYSQFYAATLLYSQGKALPDAWSELSNIINVLSKMKHQFSIDVVHCVQEAVAELMSINNTGAAVFDLEDIKKRNNFFALGHRAIFQTQLLYHAGHYQAAYQMCVEAEKLNPYLSGLYLLATHNLYYCLTLAALYPTASTQEQITYYEKIIQLSTMFKDWVQNCPENFKASYLLICAEIARIDKKLWEAGELYDQAIEAAQVEDQPPRFALANELAGRFWFLQKRNTLAQPYLSNAYLAYQRWGAKKIMQQMKTEYHTLLKANSGFEGAAVSNPTFAMTATTNSLVLDMQNVVKASQMISSDIELEKLLFNMMKIIIETAGAQKGTLFLHRNGKLTAEAEYTDEGQIHVLQHLPLLLWKEGAISIIEFVKNTGQLVMLGRAAEDNQFRSDLYLSSKNIKSVLCIAIKHQEEFRGILYVENNLAYHAFTQTRAAVLTILTSQMAISLENARLVEEKVEALNKITQEQHRRAEEAVANKANLEEFIDTLCHELRNPLNGIYGGVQLAQENVQQLRQYFNQEAENLSSSIAEHMFQALMQTKENLVTIENCAQQQKVVVDDVLDLSKLENDKIQLNPTSFDLQALLKHVLKMWEAVCLQKGLKISVKLPDEPLWLMADSQRLTQIIVNLLSNAIKFTENGEIRITINLAPKEFNEQQLQLSIEDTGRGMSPDELNRLFNRFVQANPDVSRQYGGSGLGLVISKKLVEKMGGTIAVTSKKWVGTCFSFTIACKKVAPDLVATLQTHSPEMATKVQPSKGLTILIAEDNAVNQRILSRYLEAQGHFVIIANDGLEAIKKHADYQLDLIFMDIEMPHKNGIEATREIRMLEEQFNKTPVVIIGLSGNARAEQKLAGFAAGMNAYITKPFKQEEIYSAIRKYVTDKLSPVLKINVRELNYVPTKQSFFPLVSPVQSAAHNQELSNKIKKTVDSKLESITGPK